jgi:hypothetical protein
MTGRVLSFPWPQLSADNFGAFWQLYPRRVAKLDAQRAWARLTSQQRSECLARLPLHVDYWHGTETLRQFIPHPATFLNGRRWEDEIEDNYAPLRDMGQCDWNKNGTREPGQDRCAHRATVSSERGQAYCEKHALALGIGKKRKA